MRSLDARAQWTPPMALLWQSSLASATVRELLALTTCLSVAASMAVAGLWASSTLLSLCEFAEEWLDAWRRLSDAFVANWLPRQTSAMQPAYNYGGNSTGAQLCRSAQASKAVMEPCLGVE